MAAPITYAPAPAGKQAESPVTATSAPSPTACAVCKTGTLVEQDIMDAIGSRFRTRWCTSCGASGTVLVGVP